MCIVCSMVLETMQGVQRSQLQSNLEKMVSLWSFLSHFGLKIQSPRLNGFKQAAGGGGGGVLFLSFGLVSMHMAPSHSAYVPEPVEDWRFLAIFDGFSEPASPSCGAHTWTPPFTFSSKFVESNFTCRQGIIQAERSTRAEF